MTTSVDRPVGAASAGTRIPAARGATRARTWRLVAAFVVVVVLVVELAVIRPEVGGALRSLWNVDYGWLAVAVLAAAASMGVFALVRRTLLRAAGFRVPVRATVAAVLVANSVHATLPGGVAFSTGYTYRWMRGRGVSGPAATWSLAAGGLVSTAALLAFGVLGSLLAGSQAGWLQLALAVTGIVLCTAAVRHLARHPRTAAAVGKWVLRRVNAVRRRPSATGADALDGLVAELRLVRPRSRDWTAATGYALLNWAFDAACLAACAAALDVRGLTLPLLLVAYTAGMATSGVSPLPGGLGVVDAALVLTLVAGGIPAAAALPAVVLYRLISLVGLVGAGWLVCAVQQVHGLRGSRAPGH
jgi:uncharacterized membrane protein YbhN (UPF0104 family)